MGSISSTSSVSSVTINGVNVTGKVWNVPVALANTEVSFALPSKTHKFLLRPRTPCTIQFSYDVGTSGTDYLTILPRTNFTDENFYASQTIYFQADVAGVVMEIVTYST